jgi:hypothetical protein
MSVESQQSVAPAATEAVSEDKEPNHVTTDAQTEEEKKSFHDNKASSKKFSIVLDRISNTRYAAELEQEENITIAKLYMRAKRGRYQPIWFDPNDPNKSKASPSRPAKGWQHWTIPLDDTYQLLGPTVSKLSMINARELTKPSEPSV